jgi:hypothetical protein
MDVVQCISGGGDKYITSGGCSSLLRSDYAAVDFCGSAVAEWLYPVYMRCSVTIVDTHAMFCPNFKQTVCQTEKLSAWCRQLLCLRCALRQSSQLLAATH